VTVYVVVSLKTVMMVGTSLACARGPWREDLRQGGYYTTATSDGTSESYTTWNWNVEYSEIVVGGVGQGGPGIPLTQWVDPSSLNLKKIGEAWYGSARINEEIGALKIPGGYARVHLNTTVNFDFSGSLLKKDVAQYLVATAMDRARAAVWDDLYENPAMSNATAASNFKEYFAIHLMRLTYGSEVKSYAFPGVSTFNVKFQWYPSLPPIMVPH